MTEPAVAGRWLGAVLAGGRSRRFGRPKARAPFLGRPLVFRPADALDTLCRDVVVVGDRARLPDSFPYRVIPDEVAGAGPLAGLHSALVEAKSHGDSAVLLLGCDMPLVTSDLLRMVALEGTSAAGLAAVPAGGARDVEPLCGWYATGCLPHVVRRLRGPDRSLVGFLEEVGAHRIPRDRLGTPADVDRRLRSVNTPAELERLQALEEGALREGRSEPTRRTIPPVVCVVGFKNSGKTGVAVGLVAELRRRGHRVAAIKHGHGFQIDSPGTDSWRLRHEGGADPVLMVGPNGFASMGGWGPRGEPGLEALLRRGPPEADLIVAEGFKGSDAARIEVHRGGPGAERVPRRRGGGRLLALVSDSPLAAEVPELAPDDPGLHGILADLVEREVMT